MDRITIIAHGDIAPLPIWMMRLGFHRMFHKHWPDHNDMAFDSWLLSVVGPDQ